MSTNVIIGDILNQNRKYDAVVNSLGRNGRSYGKICALLLKYANNEGITNSVNNIVNGNINYMFATGSGELSNKFKNIIHIITPIRSLDDNDLSMLTNCYKKVINQAIDLNCTSIIIPLLSTGANGYSIDESFKAYRKAYHENFEYASIDITLISYDNSNKDKYDKEYFDYYKSLLESFDRYDTDLYYEPINNRRNIRDFGVCGAPVDGLNKKESSKPSKPIPSVKRGLTHLRFEDKATNYKEINRIFEFMCINDMKYKDAKTPGDFLRKYMEEIKIKPLELVGHAHGRYTVSMINEFLRYGDEKKKPKQFSKADAIFLPSILHMGRTVALQFFIICGYSFNPYDELDFIYREYLVDNDSVQHFISDLYCIDEKLYNKYFKE